ncbi:hypothetical protein MPC4_20135 [Methylocella tundrae]|uniref:Uncharacterized protein n=1 Tax=Methylocella tundrae TaxID=227605 RepID=A0A8B6M521_METTU|nr:hypothetical protein MPC1_9190003 [Methylocella tundrae]VTZ49925.1 hypothetical protein MPC4_20135 [Methylocella tundrae]
MTKQKVRSVITFANESGFGDARDNWQRQARIMMAPAPDIPAIQAYPALPTRLEGRTFSSSLNWPFSLAWRYGRLTFC